MDYYSAYSEQFQNGGSRGGGIPRVFVGSPYQRGHGIGSFLGGLFRRVLPYLARGARAVGKEALRAGANVIEDLENNTPFSVSVKNRFKESRDKLKRKAEEKISSLMQGSGYKWDPKMRATQFPFVGANANFAKLGTAKASTLKRGRRIKKNLTANSNGKNKRSKNRIVKKRSTSTKRRKKISKKRSVSDIFS